LTASISDFDTDLDTRDDLIWISFYLNSQSVIFYERYRPQIIVGLSKIGGIIALLKIGTIINMINWFLFKKEAAKDNIVDKNDKEILEEKFSFEKINNMLKTEKQLKEKI
jgi:hypothetical protein